VTALGLLAAACSSSTADLNIGKAENEIRTLTVKQYGNAVRVGAARCPQSVEQKKGKTFTCIVVVDGQRLTIRVDQRDDKGNVHITQGQAVISTTKAESFVEQYAQRKGTPLTSVTCARTKVVVRSPGQTVTCQVRYADGATGTARMQVGDTSGKVGIQRLTRQ
jgi:Domain of unknown function (DUF4333)